MNQTTDFDHPMTDTIPPPTLTWNTEEDPDERPYLIYFPESGGELVQDGKKGSRSWTAHSGIAFATNLEDRHLEKLPQLLSAFPYLEASGIRTKVGALDEVASLKASLYGEEHRDQGMTAQSKLFKVLEEGLGVEVWTADNADMVKDRHDNRFFYRKPLSLASERSGGSPTMQGHTTTFNNSNIPPPFLTVKDRAQRFSPQALASSKLDKSSRLESHKQNAAGRTMMMVLMIVVMILWTMVATVMTESGRKGALVMAVTERRLGLSMHRWKR
jgi:hypothetical protein